MSGSKTLEELRQEDLKIFILERLVFAVELDIPLAEALMLILNEPFVKEALGENVPKEVLYALNVDRDMKDVFDAIEIFSPYELAIISSGFARSTPTDTLSKLITLMKDEATS